MNCHSVLAEWDWPGIGRKYMSTQFIIRWDYWEIKGMRMRERWVEGVCDLAQGVYFQGVIAKSKNWSRNNESWKSRSLVSISPLYCCLNVERNWSKGEKPKCACVGGVGWLKETWRLKRRGCRGKWAGLLRHGRGRGGRVDEQLLCLARFLPRTNITAA